MQGFYPALLFFFLGFFIRSVVFYSVSTFKYAKFMKDLELKFLLLTSNYLQWREQALEALKLTYKFIEVDKPEEKEIYDEMLKKVEEKYNEIIEEYIKQIKNILPYEADYDNFDGVKKYITKMSRNVKNG